MFILSQKNGVITRRNALQSVPIGHLVAGVSFHPYQEIVTSSEASDFISKATKIGSWTFGPARFVMENAKNGLLRLTPGGNYESQGGEYPVGGVYSNDANGRILRVTMIDGKHSAKIEIADFIRSHHDFKSLKIQMDDFVLNEGIKELGMEEHITARLDGSEKRGTPVMVLVRYSGAFEAGTINYIHQEYGIVEVELTHNRGSVGCYMDNRCIKKLIPLSPVIL